MVDSPLVLSPMFEVMGVRICHYFNPIKYFISHNCLTYDDYILINNTSPNYHFYFEWSS